MSTMHSARRATRAVGAGLALAFSLVLAGCGEQAGAPGGPPPAAPVSVAPAVQRTVTDSEEFSGRLEASEFVELRPRIAGTIDQLHFADGALVKKGQLLFSIDPRPFAAEVARTESLLAAVTARAELAQTELARSQKLLDARAVSRQEFDQLNAGARTSQADIRSADAALRAARLNLEFATVRAPIAGRVSRANVTAGNLVNDQTVLTTIAGTATLFAYFDVSEQSFLRVRGANEKTPRVRMGLANENGRPHEGRVDFIDNRLNPQTGAMRMRASFDNSAGLFTPGLAVTLTMGTSAPYTAVLVPDRAIGTDQTKRFVYVVGADNLPQVRNVPLGALFDGMRVIGSGSANDSVKPGENVIVDGLQRVVPGMKVAPQVLKVDAQGIPIPAAAASAPPAKP